MIVLDLDLDFFLHRIVTIPLPPDRPSSEDVPCWTTNEVNDFLLNQCGLAPDAPLPGCIVTEHHELFDVWQRLIERGDLTVPFDLVHVDAHADMGMGDASDTYIMSTLLHMDVAERTSPKRGGNEGLLPGNYVAYAIACRWIRSFTYVHHPRLRPENQGFHDIPKSFLKNYDLNSDRIEFKAVSPEAAPKKVHSSPA